MDLLLLLCRYNNWANARMLNACRDVRIVLVLLAELGVVGGPIAKIGWVAARFREEMEVRPAGLNVAMADATAFDG